MKQTCGKVNDTSLTPLEGSVAYCSIDQGVLTKRHLKNAGKGLKDASRAFRAAGVLMDMVTPGASVALKGLADACDLELDPVREFEMQKVFYNFAEVSRSGVRIPEPFSVLSTGNGLSMEYLGSEARRFCDCTNEEDMARAVVFVSRLFFSTIEVCGIVHGDISQTNVMIDSKGTPCLVDFGCCFKLPDGGNAMLDAKHKMNETTSTPETGFILRIWMDRAWKDGWDVTLSEVKLSSLSFDGHESMPGIALYLRSLMALTLMAQKVPAVLLRQAEANWEKLHPVTTIN